MRSSEDFPVLTQRIRKVKYFVGVLAAFLAWACIKRVVLFQGVFEQLLRSAAPLHIRRAPAHVLMDLLGSAFGVVALVCFLVFPSLLSLFRGVGASPQFFFPLNSLFSVTGA